MGAGVVWRVRKKRVGRGKKKERGGKEWERRREGGRLGKKKERKRNGEIGKERMEEVGGGGGENRGKGVINIVIASMNWY